MMYYIESSSTDPYFNLFNKPRVLGYGAFY
jgi:hypothetical protein